MSRRRNATADEYSQFNGLSGSIMYRGVRSKYLLSKEEEHWTVDENTTSDRETPRPKGRREEVSGYRHCWHVHHVPI